MLMAKRSIVTITDHNHINQMAMIIMLRSLLLNSPHIGDISVLYIEGQISIELLAWLKRLHIRAYPYSIDIKDDPYIIKFLLSNYIKNEGSTYDEILYLDPDHIVLSSVSLESHIGVLNVSSEVKSMEIDPDCQSPYGHPVIQHISSHYNTSLIYGRTECWHDVVETWAEVYQSIRALIPMRFREEIAFCAASRHHNIDTIPVLKGLQSNFSLYEPDCVMFHYGGESHESIMIKACLRNEKFVRDRVAELYKVSNNNKLKWLAEKILAIIDSDLTKLNIHAA